MEVLARFGTVVAVFLHYVKLFGARGITIGLDRIARKVAFAKGYERLARYTWMHPYSTFSRHFRVSGVLLQGFGNTTRGWFQQDFLEVISQKAAASDAICQHIFNFLGTGLCQWGDPIDWHQDVKSGYRWPRSFYSVYGSDLMPGHGVDIKIPWELSRCQHFVTLAQTWWITGEKRFAEECFGQWEGWIESNP